MKKEIKTYELVCPWLYEVCPKCGYALIMESRLRQFGIRECARCDFRGKLHKCEKCGQPITLTPISR